jgi:outer membrane protein assembly factor BamA
MTLAVTVAGAQGASDSTGRTRVRVLPIAGYASVTGLQYGVTAIRRLWLGPRTDTRPSFDGVYFARTARGHAKAYVQGDYWTGGNAQRLRARIEYMSYPLPFYGIGARTANDAEEWYSAGATGIHLLGQQELTSQNYLVAGLRYTRTRMHDVDPDGALALRTLPGSVRSTVAQWQLGVARDSRDNLSAPRSGTYARLTASAVGRVLGSEFRASRLTLDARHYRSTADHHVLAGQIQYDGMSGTLPFDQLPQIGSDTALRGYPRGRFRDAHAISVQAEYRSPYWRRAGYTVFVGAGTVGARFVNLTSSPWYPSVGAGMRALLSPRERTVARLDLGVGRRSVGVTIGLGEAF